MKSILERVEGAGQLWQVIIGDVEFPSGETMFHWCGTYSDNEIEHALIRAASKIHRGDVLRTTPEVEKYVRGVLVNEARQTKDRLARKLERVRSGGNRG